MIWSPKQVCSKHKPWLCWSIGLWGGPIPGWGGRIAVPFMDPQWMSSTPLSCIPSMGWNIEMNVRHPVRHNISIRCFKSLYPIKSSKCGPVIYYPYDSHIFSHLYYIYYYILHRFHRWGEKINKKTTPIGSAKLPVKSKVKDLNSWKVFGYVKTCK